VDASITSFCRKIFLVAMITLVLSGSAKATSPVPAEVRSAKTVYLVNETGNEKVLATATDQFTSWGRFAIAKSKDDADLIVVFTHKTGVDKWGNLGITEMDVFVKGQKNPAFIAKDALKLLGDREHPTKACIHDFRNRVEAKN
jgi:hypothetical protein